MSMRTRAGTALEGCPCTSRTRAGTAVDFRRYSMSQWFERYSMSQRPSNGFGHAFNPLVVWVPFHLAHPRWNGFEMPAAFDVSTVVIDSSN